jgi:hypothetical protein
MDDDLPSAPPRAREITDDLKITTPPKAIIYPWDEYPERPPSASPSTPPELQLPRRPSLNTPSTVKKRKRQRVNQKPKTPKSKRSTTSNSNRRNPRTIHFSLRSSRFSPPRFGTDDDAIARGSPRHYNKLQSQEEDLEFAANAKRRLEFESSPPQNLGGFDDNELDFGFNDHFDPTIGQEDNDEGCLFSVKEKHEAIMERIQLIVGEYWNVLSGIAFTYARISQRCFVLQDWDLKRDYLRVPLLSRT